MSCLFGNKVVWSPVGLFLLPASAYNYEDIFGDDGDGVNYDLSTVKYSNLSNPLLRKLDGQQITHSLLFEYDLFSNKLSFGNEKKPIYFYFNIWQFWYISL